MNTERRTRILQVVHEKLAASRAAESARQNYAAGGTPSQQAVNAAQATQPVVKPPVVGASSSDAIGRFHKNTVQRALSAVVNSALASSAQNQGRYGKTHQVDFTRSPAPAVPPAPAAKKLDLNARQGFRFMTQSGL